MIAFLTERWNRSHYALLALWGLSTILLILSIITPFGAIIGGSILSFTAMTTSLLSLAVTPLLVVNGFQVFYNWLQLLINHSPAAVTQVNPEQVLPEHAPIPEMPEPFEFVVPETLRQEPDAILMTRIDNPQRSYTYSSGAGALDDSLLPLESAFLAHLLQAYQKERALHVMPDAAPLHVCIIGLGPTGLMAALRAYAHGASITAIDSRDKYTRKNVFRLTPDFLLGKPHELSLPYNLMDSIFFRQHLVQSRESQPFDLSSMVVRRFPINPHGINMDTTFDGDDPILFHTIETNEFEHVLFSILAHLQMAAPTDIEIYRGHTICGIKAEQGLVSLKKGYEFTQLKADWIVNATGANGRLAQASSIADAIFPYKNPPTDSPQATYLAATLTTKFGKGRLTVIGGNRLTVPHGFSVGAERAMTSHPSIASEIRSRTLAYHSAGSGLTKHNTLHEQSVFYGYRTKEHYLENLSFGNNRGSDNRGIEIDLACSYYGVLDSLEKMQRFGWQRTRLPLIRQLNTAKTIYVGMEIPSLLFNHLTSDDLELERKDQLFQAWIKIALEQLFHSGFIERLSIEQGAAFSVQMRVSNQIMHRYPSGVKVFNLGDVLSPPHFLTGSGVETAAISVQHWIEHMQDGNDEEYCTKIQTNVQRRAIGKVEGLRELSIFAPQVEAQERLDGSRPSAKGSVYRHSA